MPSVCKVVLYVLNRTATLELLNRSLPFKNVEYHQDYSHCFTTSGTCCEAIFSLLVTRPRHAHAAENFSSYAITESPVAPYTLFSSHTDHRPVPLEVMPASNRVFCAFSFISSILVSIPLPWHLQARNTATCLYMLWVSLTGLTVFINTVLWDGNVVDRSPVWCDFSKFI
jgi:Pheromone A receptor